MPTTITYHRIQRHVLQGRTAMPVSVTAVASAAEQAYSAMSGALWRAVAPLATTMPQHSWAQTGSADNYDAYKFCGDYGTGTRMQHVYAGAVDYVVKVPSDALVGGACNLTSLTVTLYGDRWLADGAILAAIPSASAVPPTWAQVLAATTQSAAVMAVTPANLGPDQTADVTLTFPGATAVTAYVHLILRLADYATHRGSWVEGGATIDYATLSVVYSRAPVVADAAEAVAQTAPYLNTAYAPAQSYRFAGYYNGSATGSDVITPSSGTLPEWQAAMFGFLNGGNVAASDDAFVGAVLQAGSGTADKAILYGRAFTRSFVFPRQGFIKSLSWATAFAPSSGVPIRYSIAAYICAPYQGADTMGISPQYLVVGAGDAGLLDLAEGQRTSLVFTTPARTYSVIAAGAVQVDPGQSVSSISLAADPMRSAVVIVVVSPVAVLSLPGTARASYGTSWTPGAFSLNIL